MGAGKQITMTTIAVRARNSAMSKPSLNSTNANTWPTSGQGRETKNKHLLGTKGGP